MSIKKRNIGQVINELSSKPVTFEVTIAAEVFKLKIIPPSPDIMLEYGKLAKDIQESDASQIVPFFASKCIRTEEGEVVWDMPEDFKVVGPALNTIRNEVYQHCLGVNLTEFAIKNLQGSLSSEAASQ